MKKIILASISALFLTACSDVQLAKFQSGLNNFQAGVLAVNQAIADVSPALLQNCNNLLAVENALIPFAVGTKWAPDAQAAAAVINTSCQAPPASNIQGVVVLTAQAVTNAQAAYNAARKAQGK